MHTTSLFVGPDVAQKAQAKPLRETEMPLVPPVINFRRRKRVGFLFYSVFSLSLPENHLKRKAWLPQSNFPTTTTTQMPELSLGFLLF